MPERCAAGYATPVIRRVPALDDEQQCPYDVGAVVERRKLPGLSGRPSFRVNAIERQRLGDVTATDALAEGRISGNTRARQRWQIQWVKENDRRWAATHPTASGEDILRRFRTRHADRYCWVLTIALQDPIRCMAEQRDILTGRTQGGKHAAPGDDQYVRSGGIDPYAEAVDAATQARLVADAFEARTRTKAQHGLRKAGLKYARVGLARRST
jgi:hypothetical protein